MTKSVFTISTTVRNDQVPAVHHERKMKRGGREACSSYFPCVQSAGRVRPVTSSSPEMPRPPSSCRPIALIGRPKSTMNASLQPQRARGSSKGERPATADPSRPPNTKRASHTTIYLFIRTWVLRFGSAPILCHPSRI